jgi:cytochrome c oxidase subunit 3
LADHFATIAQQREAARLGMWVFLATEVLIFGGMFAGYSAYLWVYREAFEAATARLNLLIGAINTVVLLASSLTMAMAVYAAHTDRQRLLVNCLILTAGLGALFMAFKALEYYTDYRENLVPLLAFSPEEWSDRPDPVNPGHVQLFLMFYYILTGLHAVHLTIGIGIVLVLVAMAARGRFGPERFIPVELVGLYWHFVDVIWIFLLPLLYLTGTHSLHDLHF